MDHLREFDELVFDLATELVFDLATELGIDLATEREIRDPDGWLVDIEHDGSIESSAPRPTTMRRLCAFDRPEAPRG